jgi:hypothetical protein
VLCRIDDADVARNVRPKAIGKRSNFGLMAAGAPNTDNRM